MLLLCSTNDHIRMYPNTNMLVAANDVITEVVKTELSNMDVFFGTKCDCLT